MKKPPVSSHLRALWDDVRTSLWFVPSFMMVAGILISAAAIWLDHRGTGNGQDAPVWVYVSTADDARNLISTLLSAMITMTSLVFSITMVVLTLAASQFGPRLVRNFMASPQTQIVLGTFVMTILYCLPVVSGFGGRESESERPFFTVTIAIVLTGVSTALLVLFIHSLARSIVSETVVERVGRELDDTLATLETLSCEQEELAPQDALPAAFEQDSSRFGPQQAGYVQAIEFDQLVEAGTAAKVVIVLNFRPGDYVGQGGNAILVCPRDGLSPELRQPILDAIAFGVHRTPVQDIEYSIRHLVEIAVRALSPSVNDPYTAVAVVHRLSASLSLMMERALPPGVFRDEAGAVRVVAPRPNYATMIGAAFDQIRQFSADKPLLLIHLIEALGRIAEHATMPSQIEAIGRQLTSLAEDAERDIRNSSDRASVGEKARKALELLSCSGGCRPP